MGYPTRRRTSYSNNITIAKLVFALACNPVEANARTQDDFFSVPYPLGMPRRVRRPLHWNFTCFYHQLTGLFTSRFMMVHLPFFSLFTALFHPRVQCGGTGIRRIQRDTSSHLSLERVDLRLYVRQALRPGPSPEPAPGRGRASRRPRRARAPRGSQPRRGRGSPPPGHAGCAGRASRCRGA